jgi:hypothetical protein
MVIGVGALLVLPIHGILGTWVLLTAALFVRVEFVGVVVGAVMPGVAQPRQSPDEGNSIPMKPGTEPESEAVDVQ